MYVITLVDFGPMIVDFYDYMGRDKKPGNDRIALWFNKIKKYQASDVRDAFEWMKSELDSLPHNIPKAINRGIFETNRSKPQQTIGFKKYGDCEDCNSTGIFKLRMCTPLGSWYEPIIFCSRCDNYKNWTNAPGDRMNKSEIEAMNVRFKPYNKVLTISGDAGEKGGINDIKKMAVRFGENKRLNTGEKYKDRNIDYDQMSDIP
jgi:hypothetical protein